MSQEPKGFLENVDSVTKKRIELCIITFGSGVKIVSEFKNVLDIEEVYLDADGASTPMGGGIQTAIKKIEERKLQYRGNGSEYYRPWIWLITDGGPTDMGTREGTYYRVRDDAATDELISNDAIEIQPFFELWEKVREDLSEGESKKHFVFFAVGVEGADMGALKELSQPGREPLALQGMKFVEMFDWLSKSISEVSRSHTGEQIKLSDPSNWGIID